ncbi:MAG: DUF4325 domain-containing protein [Burkholderiales bacterium]|nr:DUF4325 domain-containing protein [Burkholderiales bacterium]
MARIDLNATTQWITAAAISDGARLPDLLAERLGVTRRSACNALRRLVALQWLTVQGCARRRVYRPGALRQVVRRYAIAGLEEDAPWRHDFAPCFELAPELLRMVRHAYTELLNNAVSHSGGTQVTVSMRQTPLQVQLLISDDGCGLFERIQQGHAIADPALAMFELAKGKLTTSPDRHRGHGLYFSSRLADVFDIHANGVAYQCRNWDERRWHAGRPVARVGTTVFLAFAIGTPRTLGEVARRHSADGAGTRFDCTEVPLHLLGQDGGGGLSLVSRAEARRVVARLAGFERAELDFGGIAEIGQGFADELFRVLHRELPRLELVPRRMSERVAAMAAAV